MSSLYSNRDINVKNMKINPYYFPTLYCTNNSTILENWSYEHGLNVSLDFEHLKCNLNDKDTASLVDFWKNVDVSSFFVAKTY